MPRHIVGTVIRLIHIHRFSYSSPLLATYKVDDCVPGEVVVATDFPSSVIEEKNSIIVLQFRIEVARIEMSLFTFDFKLTRS